MWLVDSQFAYADVPIQRDVATYVNVRASDYSTSYRVGCQVVKLGTLPVGATPRINIQRIDVDDVAFTNPDGSVTTIPGTYTVAPLTDTDTCLRGQTFPTKTGIDVPPGAYNVTVTYTNNGQTISNGYHLDLK